MRRCQTAIPSDAMLFHRLRVLSATRKNHASTHEREIAAMNRQGNNFEANTWPPKNRNSEPLLPLLIQIVSADGIEEFDPNTLIIQTVRRHRKFAPMPDERSELSGEPAIIYRADDLELRLSPPELQRLISCALREEEFFALLDRYGMAFEWHEDFYDPLTGLALQPKL